MFKSVASWAVSITWRWEEGLSLLHLTFPPLTVRGSLFQKKGHKSSILSKPKLKLPCRDLQVLGMPLYYTINPKKQCVDYIAVGVDLLSITAFKQGVHKPATKAELSGQNIMDVCPVYLDEDHFKRALPHLNFVLKVNLLPKLLKSLNRLLLQFHTSKLSFDLEDAPQFPIQECHLPLCLYWDSCWFLAILYIVHHSKGHVH